MKPAAKAEPEAPAADDKPAPEPKVEAAKPPEGAKPKITQDFRQQFVATQKERDTLKAELEKIKQEASKPKDDPEKKALVERVTKMESDLAEAHKELRLAKFEKSPDYEKEHGGKIKSAWGSAIRDVTRLKITDDDGNGKLATADDFAKIMRMEPEEAAEASSRLFGNAAPFVINHYDRIREATQNASEAIRKSQEEYGEREKTTMAEQAKQREQSGQLWTKTNTAILEKFPEHFKPVDGDEEGNKLLADGFRAADLAFGDGNGQTPEQRVGIHAWVRNAAGAFPRLIGQNRKLQAQITELQTKLKAFEASEPGPGDGEQRKPNGDAGALPSIDDDFAYMARTGAKTPKR